MRTIQKLLIIGCGTIGRIVAKSCETIKEIERVYIYDKNPDRMDAIRKMVKKAQSIKKVENIVDDVDVVLEAASQQAVIDFGLMVLKNGKDLLVMSVGALVNDELRNDLIRQAEISNCNIYIPSGAIGGIDALYAISPENIDEVVLTTTKHPDSFKNNKYLQDHGINIEELTELTKVYSGNARQAVKFFPENINVAATVSLAGIGFDKTVVNIYADPTVKYNIHYLSVKGKFGELDVTTKNVPSPDNPKTSYLAALSAIGFIRKQTSRFFIGL